MDTIKELEEKLKEEKLKQKWNEIQTKLQEAATKYSRKAFGNRSLRFSCLKKYIKSNFNINIVYVKGVVLNGNIQTLEDLKKYPDFDINHDIKLIGESFSAFGGSNEGSINTNTRVELRIRDMMDLVYEIPLETYENIKTVVTNSIDLIFITPIKEIKPHWSTSNKRYCTKFLKENGCKIIELTDSEAYEIKDHPFLYGNELLVNDVSKKIIEDWKKEEERLDSLDTDFYCYGEFVKRSGFHARALENLNSILRKFKE